MDIYKIGKLTPNSRYTDFCDKDAVGWCSYRSRYDRFEFDEGIEWRDANTNNFIAMNNAMQQMIIDQSKKPGVNPPSYRELVEGKWACMYSSKLGNNCESKETTPGEMKFMLFNHILDLYWEQTGNSYFPNNAGDWWNNCTSNGGNDETCAQCFVFNLQMRLGKMSLLKVENDTAGEIIFHVANNENANGKTYQFGYSFEPLFNSVADGADFKELKLYQKKLNDTHFEIYGCAQKANFDPVGNSDAYFNYDPSTFILGADFLPDDTTIFWIIFGSSAGAVCAVVVGITILIVVGIVVFVLLSKKKQKIDPDLPMDEH